MKEIGSGMLFKKDIKVFLLAIGLGVVSILLLNAYVKSKEISEEMVTVLVSTREIPAGTKIEKGMLGEKQYPKNLWNENMLGPERKTDIEGMSTNITIPAGVPILANYIAIVPEDFADKLDPQVHEQALRLSLDGPVELVKPETRIDIHGTFTQPKEVTKVLLQNVVVLQRIGSDLILKVTRDEALRLKFAATKGKLSFTIRNPKDRDIDTGRKEATMVDIFEVFERLTEERRQREARKPEIYRR